MNCDDCEVKNECLLLRKIFNGIGELTQCPYMDFPILEK